MSLDVLRLAGADNLAGKVLIDVSNPMKPDSGFPPQLDPVGDDSLAERDPAGVPDGSGRQDAQHDELRRDGRPLAICR